MLTRDEAPVVCPWVKDGSFSSSASYFSTTAARGHHGSNACKRVLRVRVLTPRFRSRRLDRCSALGRSWWLCSSFSACRS